MWDEDPVMTPYRLAAAAGGRVPGYAGPSNQKAAEVLNKYIIVDMYAKAVQGMPAEQAVAWADSELKKFTPAERRCSVITISERRRRSGPLPTRSAIPGRPGGTRHR